ncbi:MAG: hypothetical protein BroJett030_27710 [Alphaproteobacteria bacterium]|nr:MAG: hypothetical protein BroJett030_27710 [Alphaproteobacteria bacterium]
MGIWKRIGEHVELMSAMFARTGALSGERAIGEVEMELKNAIWRCTACAYTDACRDWLEDASQGSPPPAFCPNAGLIERLRASA